MHDDKMHWPIFKWMTYTQNVTVSTWTQRHNLSALHTEHKWRWFLSFAVAELKIFSLRLRLHLSSHNSWDNAWQRERAPLTLFRGTYFHPRLLLVGVMRPQDQASHRPRSELVTHRTCWGALVFVVSMTVNCVSPVKTHGALIKVVSVAAAAAAASK